ncbi:MAG: FAD-dependent oxidoreductase [Paludibacter sp.]|nr:FAD-dependent oxidoreductase [Paludibacter sp.]
MNTIFKYIFFTHLVLLLNSCRTYHSDILVVGGGASGTTAGIAAARLGVQTLIVEETEWLGGMLTSAGVSAIDGNNKMPGGLWGEFRDSLAMRYGGLKNLETGWVSNTLFEPSVGANVLLNMCKKEKLLDVWHKTKFISAVKTNKGWSVKFKKGNEFFDIKTKVLIDATELGDVAKACGVKYDIGMDSRSVSGEDIAHENANNIVQDLTYVMVLKDYGTNANKSIDKPDNYNPSLYYCSCKTPNCTNPKESNRVWDCSIMLTYGKLPNDKYMINWPAEGNDYYVNLIEMSEDERNEALKEAKNISLGFLYYIQHELGYKNLGLADDEFPTFDQLPFIPYHRESRRIHGIVRFNINHITHPFEQKEKLYRTGIAVGDYPVDHHHMRYPNWEELPDLHFYPVPSYSLPLGTIIPQRVEDLIVAEKSISVTNIVNGTTRLQPVVLQIGQVSGVLAALAVKENVKIIDIPIRTVQTIILDQKGYLMPYLDLPLSHRHFKPLQRIGSTGILRGTGKNVGWANQTWFYVDSLLKADQLADGLRDFCNMELKLSTEFITVGKATNILNSLAQQFNLKTYTTNEFKDIWINLGFNNYMEERIITRLEFAVILDKVIDPFNLKPVNFKGDFKN